MWKTLGFSTQIFLSFVLNIYGSASQISAYCSKTNEVRMVCISSEIIKCDNQKMPGKGAKDQWPIQCFHPRSVYDRDRHLYSTE